MGILQARILEWVAFPPPGDLPHQGFNPDFPHCRQIIYRLSHQGSPAFLLKTFLAPPGTSPWWNWHRLCLHSFLWAAGDRLCTISAKDRWQKDGRHKQHGRRLRVWLQKVLCVTVKLPLWLLGRLVMREMTPCSWHLAKASLKGKLNVYLFYPVTLKHKIKKKTLIKIPVNIPVVIILFESVSRKLPGRELSGRAHHEPVNKRVWHQPPGTK